MVLPSTSAPNKGFTLVEVLITIGIIALIATLGVFISFDFYRSYSFRSERSTIVSILQKARSQSMDNIDQARHGVHFDSSPTRYTLFETSSDYASRDTAKDIPIDANYGSTVSGVTDVIFNQLDGNLIGSNVTISVSDQGNTKTITINNEGQIDWQ